MLRLKVAREIYADRARGDYGRLLSRELPGAVVHDPSLAAERVTRMIAERSIITLSGKRIDEGKLGSWSRPSPE